VSDYTANRHNYWMRSTVPDMPSIGWREAMDIEEIKTIIGANRYHEVAAWARRVAPFTGTGTHTDAFDSTVPVDINDLKPVVRPLYPIRCCRQAARVIAGL
jgi:hypothetical protein